MSSTRNSSSGRKTTQPKKTYNRRTAAARNAGSRSSSKKELPAGKQMHVNDYENSNQNRAIVGIVTGIICLVLFLCMIGVINGAIGLPIKGFLMGIFGILAYVMPFVIFGAVFFIYWNKDDYKKYIKNTILITLLLFAVGSFCSLVSSADIAFISKNPGVMKNLYDIKSGGGCIFGLLAVLLCIFLGKTGSIIVDIVLILGLIYLLGPGSINNFIKGLGSKLSFIDDYDDEYEDENEFKKKRQDIMLPANVDNGGENTNLLAIAEDRREQQELERIEKQKAREEARAKKQQKIEEKKLKEDRADDDRIVNSSRKRNDFDLSGGEHFGNSLVSENGNMVHSKDDVHEITLISNPESAPAETEKPKVNVTIPGDIKEITKEQAPEEKSSEPEISPIEQIQKINIRRYDSGSDTDVLPEKTEEPAAEVKKEEPIVIAPSHDDTIVAPSVAKSEPGEFEPAPLKEEKNFVDINSVTKFTPITQRGGAEIDLMPEPITEKTHQAESEALSKQLEKKKPVKVPRSKYKKPIIDLLNRNDRKKGGDDDKTLKETAFKLQECLKTFGVPVNVADISQGPSVTRYELSLGEGVKVSKILNLADDIKLNLAAQDVRIEAPIPGKAAVGIEIPNTTTDAVLIRDLIDSPEFKASDSNLAFAVGKDISGKTIVADIAKMPHMLIAGATGSGKSVCINTLIMSILYKAHPDDVKLIMIDPKVVELSVYNGIPHLLLPVVTDPKKASASLQWAVNEMTNRYNAFAKASVRDLKGFNKYVEDNKDNPDVPEKLPQIIVIVDELADLMMVASKEVEESICRLAQLARAAGIHLIIATQRPSVDVITGLIKANMPSRVAFRVSSGIDSRTILDMTGAERLIGKGDMLFYPQGYTKPLRVQGAFVSDEEVQKVVEFLKEKNEAMADESSDIESQITSLSKGEAAASSGGTEDSKSDVDEYFKEACRFVVEKGTASSGMLQRMYRIGFNRAARMIDQMQDAGIVSGEQGTKPRNVLVSAIELEEILSRY